MDALDDLAAIAWVAATYNGTDIPAGVESYAQTMEQSPALTVADAVVMVKAADVAQPKKNDVIAWGGTTYKVVAVLRGDGLTWRLAVNKRVVQ